MVSKCGAALQRPPCCASVRRVVSLERHNRTSISPANHISLWHVKVHYMCYAFAGGSEDAQRVIRLYGLMQELLRIIQEILCELANM